MRPPNPYPTTMPYTMPSYRPTLVGTRHVVVAGHYLAAHAGFTVLEAGGNAIDAGVAAGIALGVVQSYYVSFAGVAPMIIYIAERDELVTIDGLGTWPRAATLELFEHDHGGTIPEGLLRTVVPAAPDAWITALERYGTMSFGDVAGPAAGFAADGFAMYPLMAERIAALKADHARWPSNAAIYLPGGRVPEPGALFVQADLGRTLHYMIDEERAASSGGRLAGLAAARDAFYRGDIARTICDHHKAHGGLLSMADMTDYHVTVEPPISVRFNDLDVYTCGPWCQGPVLLQALQLLKGFDLRALGHNTPGYVHLVAEALKLAYADREHFYGDPKFIDVPMEALLSERYNDNRRALIRDDEAWPEMPPPGDPPHAAAAAAPDLPASAGSVPAPADTSYACVVDRHGNIMSATPSDPSNDTEVIPGTGLAVSSRGAQSWAQSGHASCIAPGKRPRLTPNPAIAMRKGKMHMPFGTPGGDVQTQAMLQVLLNSQVFGMTPQQAVEAPRFATHSFPNSFEPHAYRPGLLTIEQRLAARVSDQLSQRGHRVEPWPDWAPEAASVCLIEHDLEFGMMGGGADPRRLSYALGW